MPPCRGKKGTGFKRTKNQVGKALEQWFSDISVYPNKPGRVFSKCRSLGTTPGIHIQ
jgi:hypothetical protein